MRYIHRIVISATHAQVAELQELGMKLDCRKESDEKMRTLFLVGEDHPHWPLMQARLREWEDLNHIVYTEFTERERESARYLRITAWENGYALPTEDEKFFEVTFDRSNACPFCGCGKVQNAPFRIKMEPKWGRKSIMSLIWAYDELFVPPAVWETVFKPFGIACRPVANRHGKLLETVVQLVINEEVELAPERLIVRDHCKTCGRPKYQGTSRGYYPRLAHEPSGAIAKTKHTFRDGWDTRDIIISQELYRAIKSHNLRGAEFTPVEAPLEAFVA